MMAGVPSNPMPPLHNPTYLSAQYPQQPINYGNTGDARPPYGSSVVCMQGPPPPAYPYSTQTGDVCPPKQIYMDPQALYQGDKQIYPNIGAGGPGDNVNTVYGRPTSGAAGCPENPGGVSVDMVTENITRDIRHAFVRKVFAIMSLQILFTFGIAATFGYVPVLKQFLTNNVWIIIVCLLVALVLQICITCYPNLGRRVPLNFFFLSVITCCYSMLLAYGAAAAEPLIFCMAIGITFTVVVGLMLFACQTKWDFTGYTTYAFVGLLILMIFGILTIFFYNRIMILIYSSFSAVCFSFLLVFDTQQIVGGKHRKYQYSIDDYIFAALTLYLDVVIIFMSILRLLDN